MTARISLILGTTGAHRAPLQLHSSNLFTAPKIPSLPLGEGISL